MPAPTAEAPIQTLSSVTRAVLLDVVAVDEKGHAVPGLKPEDVTLLEDGVPQFFTSFEERHDTPPPATPATKLPPNTFTNAVPTTGPNGMTTILMVGGVSPFLHEELIKYLKHVPPGEAMAFFGGGSSVDLIQGLTTNPEDLIAALNGKRDPSWNKVGFQQMLHAPYVPTAASCVNGSRTQQCALDQAQLELRYRYGPGTSLGGLEGLCRYLSTIPGRKNVIWITDTPSDAFEGMAGQSVYQDTAAFADELTRNEDVLKLSDVAFYPIYESLLTRETVPPYGVYVDYYGDRRYQALAAATGGRAIFSGNGVAAAILEAVESSRTHYAVSYTPSNKQWDGGYRKITIYTHTPGVTLQSRQGYFAVDRLEQDRLREQGVDAATVDARTLKRRTLKPLTVPVSASIALPGQWPPSAHLKEAMALGTIPPIQLIFGASIAPSPVVRKLLPNDLRPDKNFLATKLLEKNFREYKILFATRIEGVHLTQSADGVRHGRLQFVAALYDDESTMVNSFLTTVQLDLSPEVYLRLKRTGVSVEQSIAIPEGKPWFLRLGVDDAIADKVGAIEIAVDRIQKKVAGLGL